MFLNSAPHIGYLGESQIQQPFRSQGREPGTPSALGAEIFHLFSHIN